VKLRRIRGENCVDASASIIRRVAKTIETTSIIEASMLSGISYVI